VKHTLTAESGSLTGDEGSYTSLYSISVKSLSQWCRVPKANIVGPTDMRKKVAPPFGGATVKLHLRRLQNYTEVNPAWLTLLELRIV